MLEAQQLAVSLGARRIVHPLDLVLRKGEMVGLIGANGSGKSTLLRALAGLLPAESGSVLLNGKPLHKLPLPEIARARAYLPQSQECHWPLCVERVVALGRLPFHGSPDEEAQAVTRALCALDAQHLRERAITQLSGGERARVFLARALAGDPSFLLLDEPAAGLDPCHQLQLMELLHQFAQQGRGILVVLHDLGIAARFCQRLLVLDHGHLTAAGPPETVLTDAVLAQVHQIQVYRNVETGFPPRERHGPKEVSALPDKPQFKPRSCWKGALLNKRQAPPRCCVAYRGNCKAG
ncbi:MAG: ABC transporter ATP-binding protein [Verrucomicrobia bacterium]|nr:ABC transporter ATP-binding protein [Verrucomicrobiota bacterium]